MKRWPQEFLGTKTSSGAGGTKPREEAAGLESDILSEPLWQRGPAGDGMY